jgi:hypothetical protein
MFTLKDITEVVRNGKNITEMILESDEIELDVRITQVVPNLVDPLEVSPVGFIPGEYTLRELYPNLSESLYSQARSWFGSWRLRAHEAINRNYEEIHFVIISIR